MRPGSSTFLCPPVVTVRAWISGDTWVLHRDWLLAAAGGQLLAPFGSVLFLAGWEWGFLLTVTLTSLLVTGTGQWVRVGERRVVVWHTFAGVPWRRTVLEGAVELRWMGGWDDLYGEGDELRLESATGFETLCPLASTSELLREELERALARRGRVGSPSGSGPYRSPGA